MSGYANVPDVPNLRAYLDPRQPWYKSAIQPWIEVGDGFNCASIKGGALIRESLETTSAEVAGTFQLLLVINAPSVVWTSTECVTTNAS